MPLTLEAQPRALSPVPLFGGQKRALAAVTAALLLVAVVLRVWQLGHVPGINGDEAWSGVQAMRLLRGEPFAWRTPTGNPVNVFYLLPLVALHSVLGPSFVVLRSVAVISGLAGVIANYWLCRRAYDRPTAVVSTVLLAVLPINIAYSRFGWDASQSLLATMFVLFLPLAWLRRRATDGPLPLGAMLALAAALVVHPTNLFAAPLVVVPICYARRRPLLARLRGASLPARPGSLVALVLASSFVAYVAWMLLAATITRLHGPGEFGEFCQNYLRLLSGATVYEYISGVDAAQGSLAAYAWLPLACKVLFGAVVVLAGWGLVRRLSTDADEVDVSLLLGWTAMLLGFSLVAGPEAIVPHLERYGICLVAPAALVVSRGLSWWIEPARTHARTAAWGLALAAWLFPLTFYLGYFKFIEQTGGLSHRAFRTAAVEPKLAAFRMIAASRRPGETIEIVASEWWLYWPLAYLALGENDVRVRGLQSAVDPQALALPDAAAATTWYVEFSGSPAERSLERNAREARLRIEQRVWCDYAENPLISAIKVGP